MTHIGFCILGDPKGDHVVIQGVPQLQVTIREDLALSAQKLALPLFFTDDDLAKGICSPQSGGLPVENC